MIDVVGVRFATKPKTYYFSPCAEETVKGDTVIVETARGVEYGTVVMDKKQISEDQLVAELKPILRKATEADLAQIEKNNADEKEAFKVCADQIAQHKLDMKLVCTEYMFDRSKILFYFTADGRVDFRELVRDLAGLLRTRIELRQIGVRDVAKMIGGLGICGRPFCCHTHLPDFHPVSVKMAKEQGMSLNPGKISGTCGRLMCCLKNEYEVYEELGKVVPNVWSVVRTPDGDGVVTAVDVLRKDVTVTFDKNGVKTVSHYNAEDITVLKKGNKKQTEIENVEELEKLE
ncbi:MAG: stage 0 sporulation family protein [Clostridia bacterium]|nr:stage 0 sporulation family protein [Clostridia bacterium]